MASPPVRFWGTVLAVKPRVVLTKFAGDTAVKCQGHLVLLDGTRAETADARPVPAAFSVAVGPATQEKRAIARGDLLRGDAHLVPGAAHAMDTPADLYRVATLRLLARAGENHGASALPPLDPPRADAPLSAEAAEAAPRRALAPANLDVASGGPCALCSYGSVVAVVRLSDPRDYRNGKWSQVPACLGPEDCPYFVPLPR